MKLNRKVLVEAHNEFTCSVWRNSILDILRNNLLDEEIEISDDYINLLNTEGTQELKNYVISKGLVLETYMDKFIKCNLKLGDKVKVIRAFQRGEQGCNITFNPNMKKFIGKTFTIEEVGYSAGSFKLKNGVEYYYFPYFVLEKVKEEYVPFSFEDDLLGKKVVSKSDKHKYIIVEQTAYGVRLGECFWEYHNLLKSFVFEDGLVCGKLKQ